MTVLDPKMTLLPAPRALPAGRGDLACVEPFADMPIGPVEKEAADTGEEVPS